MLKNYLKNAWRTTTRQKVFSFINIAGLALSLTAVWTIGLYVADELSYDRYNKNLDRIYRVVSHGQWGDEKFDVTGTSGLIAPAFKKEFPGIEEAVRIDPEGGGIFEDGDKRIKDDAVFFTDPSFFHIFTFHFLAGDINALQTPNSIVLTRSLAAKFFTNPKDALNKTIYIDKRPQRVTAVIEDVPHNSHFTFNALRPLPANYEDDWESLSIYTYILLKKNTDIKNLSAKLPAFVDRHPMNKDKSMHYSMELQPLKSIHLHSHLRYELGENHDIKYLYVLSVIGLLILITAFINFFNITTARASVRLREVAVRKIIGSGKRHLMALFLSESLIVILAAVFVSILLLTLSMPLIDRLTQKQLSVWQFGILPSMACILAFSILAAAIGGLYPALFLSGLKTIPALKNQMGSPKGQVIFRKTLVLFQFAVTVILITASLVIYRQLDYVLHTDLGFNKDQIMTFHIDSRAVRRQEPALRDALLKTPGVTAAASAGNPIGNNDIGMMDYFVEKNGVLDPHSSLAYGLTIDADFIPTLQIPLSEGRNFSNGILTDSTAAIVNEAFLKRHGWASGVGKRISRGQDASGQQHFAHIIGVVKDYHIYSLQHKIEPIIMQLPQKAEDRDNMYVRLDGQHPSKSLRSIEQTLKKFDPAAIFDYHFLDENFSAQYGHEEREGEVLLAFSLLTIFIACLGLWGLITFTVDQSVKEIGIRKVLGAGIGRITLLLTKGLLKVICISVLIAVPVSWLAMSKWLQHFAYRIHLSWWMFALAGCIALIIAVLTLSLQAIKAAMANPVRSLKTE